MYFDNFQNVLYDFTTKTDAASEVNIVTDLMRRFSLYIETEQITTFLMPYTLLEGETPEMVAHKLYGDINLHWTVMFVNNMFDVYSDWCLPTDALTEYCQDKYGAENLDKIHHWERLPDMMEVGNVVYVNGNIDTAQSGLVFYPDGTAKYDSDDLVLQDKFEIVSFTNYEYEVRENDLKRHIQVIRPAFISQFVDLYSKSALNG